MEKQEYIDNIMKIWDRLDGQELKKLKRLIRIFDLIFPEEYTNDGGGKDAQK